MIRILLCCGGGFSSSCVAQRMQNEIQKYHMTEDVMIDFSPFSIANERLSEFDIIICCPHLYIYVNQWIIDEHVSIPVYILPPRMYGRMEIKEIYQDAVDLIAMFKINPQNPIHFPNEDNVLKIARQCAYHHQ